MLTLPGAIAKQEGFFSASRPQRNHSPGDLVYGPFCQRHGATGSDSSGYAVFPSDEQGWSALIALLRGPSYRGLTVEQAINRFCPPVHTDQPLTEGNDPDQYVKNVCADCGCVPETIIDTLMGPLP